MKFLVCLDGRDEAKNALGFVMERLASETDTIHVASVAERYSYPVLDDGLDGSYVRSTLSSLSLSLSLTSVTERR